LGNAECLTGLIITQLVNPGAPFLYGYNAATLDMKTSIVSYGCPEWSMSMMAGSDLARFYGLPAWGFGGASDSNKVDAQFGAEATFSIMSAFLSRTTLVHDVGYIEHGSTSSLEALVVADEIIRMTRFMVDGIAINETTLALEVIDRARPGGGFLADDHTLDNWRWAQWTPDLIDRNRYDRWAKRGSKDMFARANERARKLLAEHDVPPLSDEVEAVIAEIVAARE
jgi:trimethylamine--corrinoid protein Co-methyltransferase